MIKSMIWLSIHCMYLLWLINVQAYFWAIKKPRLEEQLHLNGFVIIILYASLASVVTSAVYGIILSIVRASINDLSICPSALFLRLWLKFQDQMQFIVCRMHWAFSRGCKMQQNKVCGHQVGECGKLVFAEWACVESTQPVWQYKLHDLQRLTLMPPLHFFLAADLSVMKFCTPLTDTYEWKRSAIFHGNTLRRLW